MRAMLFASLALVGLAAPLQPTPARAETDYPYCLAIGGNPTDCYYSTYEQCRDTSLGISASCIENPKLAFERAARGSEPAQPRRRARNRR